MSETINIRMKGRRGEVELEVPVLKNMDAMVEKITTLYFSLEPPFLQFMARKKK